MTVAAASVSPEAVGGEEDFSEGDPFHVFCQCLAIVSLIFWFGLRILHVMAVIYGKWRLYQKKDYTSALGDKPLPGVSILKPLVNSDDPHLFSNLETYFTLDYPLYEILFCVQDTGDRQLKLYLEKLMEKYPNVDTEVFYGGEDCGVNPKINNMSPGYNKARYDLILVSDSRIKMQHDTLTDMVAYMTEKVGLVHQMPFCCDRPGVPAANLEKIYFGTSIARMYLVTDILGINAVTGMSILIRKHILDDAGGLKAFASYLAEDFFFGRAVQKAGLLLSISAQPAWQNSGEGGVSVFQSRIVRWTKLRAAMLPHLILLEPVSECVVLGSVSAWAVLYLFSWDPLSFFFVHLLLWFLMDWALLLIVQNGSLPFNKFEFLFMWLFRELTSPYLFALAQLQPQVQWRSKYFRLKWGGIAVPIPNYKEDIDNDQKIAL